MSDYLCEDMIVEILTRLPYKFLLRCRSLSKSWYSCISSPCFIRMHTFRCPQKFLFRHFDYPKQNNWGQCFYTLHGEDQFPLCPKRGYTGIEAVQFPSSIFVNILGSCNGTFCLCEFQKDITILWNPTIRRKLTIPGCPLPRGRYSDGGFGFGYDPISYDYKIVWIPFAIVYSKSSFVYSVKTGTWCAIASPTPLNFNSLSTPCFVNGALHWVVPRRLTKSDDLDRGYILTWDLSTHVFGKIMLPIPSWEKTELRAIQGSLALISTKEGDTCWIWVRKDASWSVVYNLRLNQIGGGLERVLQSTINGDLLLKTTMEGVQVYNPTKMEARSRIMDFNSSSYVSDIFPCVESLHLLDVGTACEGNQVFDFGGKRTGKIRYLDNLLLYLQSTFQPLFNLRR